LRETALDTVARERRLLHIHEVGSQHKGNGSPLCDSANKEGAMTTVRLVFGLCCAIILLSCGCQGLGLNERPDWLSKNKEKSGYTKATLDEPESQWSKTYRQLSGQMPDESVAKTLFEEGQKLYDEKKYNDAAEKFEQAAYRWPKSALEEEALFKAGESNFFEDQYVRALKNYDRLVKKYENTKYLDSVNSRRFLIAQYWEQVIETQNATNMMPNTMDSKRPWIDTQGEARRIYDNIRLQDPTGPLADDSVMATATALYKAGRFRDAAFYYDQLRKDYPRSEHQAKAHLLAVDSKLKSYQGSRYDGEDLHQAEKLIKSSLIQFPSELASYRNDLVEKQERVREQTVQRDYDMGEYYLKRGKYRAARYYYQQVLENHPESQFAVQSRQRMEEMRDLPDAEREPLEWIARPFGPTSPYRR